MTPAKTFTLTFLGDVMLGRLLDQLFPTHNPNPVDQRIANTFITSYPSLLRGPSYTHASPWGTTLPLLRDSDLTLINLETPATVANEPWPDKTFNYRMHPVNLAPILKAAGVDYVSLANNHVLDFGTEGLVETVWGLREAGVRFAGAGESGDEAFKPAVLWVSRRVLGERSRSQSQSRALKQEEREGKKEQEGGAGGYQVHVYSAADHPREWAVIPTFHLIDYSPATRVRLRTLLLSGGTRPGVTSHTDVDEGVESDVFHHREHHHAHQHQPSASSSTGIPRPALKIFSVHWGPNYAWHPAEKIRSLAHFLIDECEVDIVHGHSSHHVQGVEKYHGKVIIYGCGDFVDDYALHPGYRNDLGAVWRIVVKEKKGDGGKGLALDRLEIFPTRIDKFRALLLENGDEDHTWVKGKIQELSKELGTDVRKHLGKEGQIIVDLH